jgi:hypothetical protein
MQRVKFPIEYTLEPEEVEVGTPWVTLTLKNLGSETLKNLNVRLNSVDSYDLSVLGRGEFVPTLGPQQETTLTYQLSTYSSTWVYATLDGRSDGDPHHASSPLMRVTVGHEAAQLLSVFAMTEPYPPAGDTIRIEATIQARLPSEGLELEFWADKPDASFEELASINTGGLSRGERARYAAEITPEQEGMYSIHAYLYDGLKRIGAAVDHVWVRSA